MPCTIDRATEAGGQDVRHSRTPDGSPCTPSAHRASIRGSLANSKFVGKEELRARTLAEDVSASAPIGSKCTLAGYDTPRPSVYAPCCRCDHLFAWQFQRSHCRDPCALRHRIVDGLHCSRIPSDSSRIGQGSLEGSCKPDSWWLGRPDEA